MDSPARDGATGTAGKDGLRREVLRRRRERPAGERAAAGEALAPRVLAVLEEALAAPGAPRSVAAYASIAGEPPTAPLLATLAARRVSVLLPVLLADGDLDWAEAGAPGGPRLGREAVTSVAAVVVPGVAGDPWGARLGRGGGSYDRALTRVPAVVPTVLVLFDDEVVAAVPVEPHDRRVSHVVTPTRTLVVADRIPAGLD